MAIGSATLATPPRTSQKPDALTLAPSGAAAHLLWLRSTAGSCFGRFMIFSLLWKLRGRDAAHEERRIYRLNRKREFRMGGLCCGPPNPAPRLEIFGTKPEEILPGAPPVERGTHTARPRRHSGGLGGVAVDGREWFRSFHVMVLHNNGCEIAWPVARSKVTTCGGQTRRP